MIWLNPYHGTTPYRYSCSYRYTAHPYLRPSLRPSHAPSLRPSHAPSLRPSQSLPALSGRSRLVLFGSAGTQV